MMKILNFLLTFCLSIMQIYAQEDSFKGSFEECKALAKKENKLILVDMYFAGCMPCAEMDKRVFPDPSVQKLIQQNYILYKTDVLKELDGKKLARKYGVSGFPTYAILNAEGKSILIESGFFSVNRFVPLLQQALLLEEDNKYLAFDKNLDRTYPAAYSERFIKTGVNHSFSELEKYLAQQKDLLNEEALLAISVTNFPKYDAWCFTNLSELIQLYGNNLFRNKISRIAKQKSKTLGEKQDIAGLRELFDYVKPAFNDKLWRVFLPDFVAAYYSGSKEAYTYLMLMDEFNLYPTWEQRSNALGQVIIDQKGHKELLKKLLTAYEAQLHVGPLDFTDQYKLTLLYTYLGDFKKADQAVAQLLTQDFSNTIYTITKEEALAMQAAIKRKDANGFEAKNLRRSLKISMD